MAIESWRLLDVGPIEPLETQTIYDMIAQAITEGEADNTLIICWPAKPLVSLGYLRAQVGVSGDYQTDLSYALSSNSIGLGGAYSITNTIDLNVGFAYT